MQHLMRYFAVIAAIALLAISGCTEENATAAGDQDSSWQIGDDAELDDASDASGQNADANGDDATVITEPPQDADTEPDDVAPGDDSGPAEDAGADAEADVGGTLDEPCDKNAQCDSGQVCCADWEGNTTCTLQDDCQFGGFCDTADECADGEGCCDVFGNMVCSDRCGDGGDEGSGDPCDTNADCTNDEICCSDRNNTFCTTRSNCWTGGICESDQHCQSGETCCDARGMRGDRCIDENLCF